MRSTQRSVWLAGFLIGLPVLAVASPLPPTDPPTSPAPREGDDSGSADPEKASVVLRRLAVGAEVHAVGINEPTNRGLTKADVCDWTTLLTRLSAKNPAAEWLQGKLGEIAEGYFKDPEVVRFLGNTADPKLPEIAVGRNSILRDLEELLDRRDLHTEPAFRGLQLDKETKTLIAKGGDRSLLDTRRLNRLLLAAALPGGLNSPPDDTDTVRVRVKAGRPIILVLTAYYTCRWKVTLDGGAIVRACILSGGGWQQVEGLGCPVFTFTGCDKTGARHRKNCGFYAYEKDSQKYWEMELEVRRYLTGKTITHFTGLYRPDSNPIVVDPEQR